MGRGLSELQKTILLRALSNRKAPDRDEYTCDVYQREIMADHFGWRQSLHGWLPKSPRERDWIFGRYYFSKQKIGPRRYASVQASVSRAITRLEERGLVECFTGAPYFSSTFQCWLRPPHWSGLDLTEQGVEAAERVYRLTQMQAESELTDSHEVEGEREVTGDASTAFDSGSTVIPE